MLVVKKLRRLPQLNYLNCQRNLQIFLIAFDEEIFFIFLDVCILCEYRSKNKTAINPQNEIQPRKKSVIGAFPNRLWKLVCIPGLGRQHTIFRLAATSSTGFS